MRDGPQRTTVTQTVTNVRHVVQSFGKNSENPPSLGQLREFVAACEGLPDDTRVSLEKGPVGEAGRHSYTFSVRIVDTVDSAESTDAATES